MIIAFRGPKTTKPVLEITENDSGDVVIRFISIDEHISIHRQDDGTLLRTHYYPNKPKSSWDELRVETAKKMLLRDPERHGKYVIHTPLTKINNVAGFHLVGRLIDLPPLNPRQHYINNIEKVMNAPNDKFMLTLYLSTKDNRCGSKLESVATQLGDVCFEVSTPLTRQQ